MAIYEPHHASTLDGTALSTRAYVAVLRALSSLLDWNASRMTRKSLRKLSNRELDDIGLSRADIDQIAGYQ